MGALHLWVLEEVGGQSVSKEPGRLRGGVAGPPHGPDHPPGSPARLVGGGRVGWEASSASTAGGESAWLRWCWCSLGTKLQKRRGDPLQGGGKEKNQMAWPCFLSRGEGGQSCWGAGTQEPQSTSQGARVPVPLVLGAQGYTWWRRKEQVQKSFPTFALLSTSPWTLGAGSRAPRN